MQTENIHIEYKSLKKITSGDAGFKDLAATAVCFANAEGGKVIIGLDDKDKQPPAMQTITDDLMSKTVTRLRMLCYNVGIILNPKEKHENGGEFFSITIQPAKRSIATTSDGKVLIRVGDQCQPVRGEDITRLASEKDTYQWELHPREILSNEIDLTWFANEIRQSDRVKPFVKDMSNQELAEHYNLIHKNSLTNLGVLWLGSPPLRSRLKYAITVQYIVYDDLERKVRKLHWCDYLKNPKELLLEIEEKAVELTYFDEFPDGLLRKKVRHYDPRVIRELLINAFAHKSYTISGDIFIKVFPNRLEITNPGGLPLGITKENILQAVSRRNPHLIRIFHDLKLMEGEGSGFDLIYEIAGRDAKPPPMVFSDFNATTITQYSGITDEESLLIMDFVAKNYPLSQKEFIALGIVVRHKKILSTQLTKELQLPDHERLYLYLDKLVKQSVLITRGAKKGTAYLINPGLIKSAKINIKPTLKTIEPHRLKALIVEDLAINTDSKSSQIQKRLIDLPIAEIRKALLSLEKEKKIVSHGAKKGKIYRLAKEIK